MFFISTVFNSNHHQGAVAIEFKNKRIAIIVDRMNSAIFDGPSASFFYFTIIQ